MTRSFTLAASFLAAASFLGGCAAEGAADTAEQDALYAGADAGYSDSGNEGAEERVRKVPTGSPFSGYSLFVDPDSRAADQAAEWRSGYSYGAEKMDVLAKQPVSVWLGDWDSGVADSVDDALDAAGTGKLRSFVVYNIPYRDCGAWSAGGAANASEYYGFISEIARGMGGRKSIVILEPDALGLMDCLSSSQQAERRTLMYSAVSTLTAAGAKVYIDAGDANWVQADDMAAELFATGISNAAGFALNVSHTETRSDTVAYANELRAIVGTKAHFVMDSSRSGNGPTWDNEWCNPREGTAIGELPSLNTGVSGLDAFLWVKPPGESDGYCNGGPAAGDFWSDYALELAVNGT